MHTLRHSFATQLSESGVSTRIIKCCGNGAPHADGNDDDYQTECSVGCAPKAQDIAEPGLLSGLKGTHRSLRPLRCRCTTGWPSSTPEPKRPRAPSSAGSDGRTDRRSERTTRSAPA
nr:hypothetical protein [Ensifer aridi]